jgi:hypothetical protein
MGALTRWTKAGYWITGGTANSGTPPTVGINHNLAYLESTKLVPNFMTSITISSTQISSAWNTWTGMASGDPYDPVDFTLNQSAPGARNYPADEIGPYTGMETMWLYTGDYRAQQMAIRYAELAGGWQVHWREGSATRNGTTRWFDRANTVPAVGHWVNTNSRPTMCEMCGSTMFNYYGASYDAVTPITASAYGLTSNLSCVGGANNWCPDVAHMPDFTPIYLLTGDYYFLEEDWAWASWTQMGVSGQSFDYTGRGPSGIYGHMPGNSWWGSVRGNGWALRDRVETEANSPDNTPEKTYYDLLTQDLLGSWEGERNITTGAYNGNTMWTWGNQFANPNYCVNNPSLTGLWCANAINGVQNGPPTAIHFWVADGGTAAQSNNDCQYPIDTTQANNLGCTSPWMVQYVIYALGRARDVGYPAQALLNWVGSWQIGAVTDPTFNPYLAGAYRMATVQANGQYFTTWAGILSTVCSSTATGCIAGTSTSNAQTAQTFDPPNHQYGSCGYSPFGDGNCSGAYELGIAVAQLADQTNGAAAWSWVLANAMSNSQLASDPKWAMSPRTASSSSSSGTTTTPSSNACDLNGDNVVNATDVQLAINQVLGILPCTTADLLHTGQCTVVDVQRVINASLGQACLTN